MTEETGTRRETVREDEHASIVQSLTRIDWLVLLVVALYTLVLRAPEGSPRLLYAAMATYTLFLVAFRWRGFPVKDAGARIALGAAAMVAFITVVAIPTGGSESPMVNLYLLPIVVVAMTLGRRGAFVIFAGVALAWLSLVAIKDMAWTKQGASWSVDVVPVGGGIVRWAEVGKALTDAKFTGTVSIHGEYDAKDLDDRKRLAKAELVALQKYFNPG